MTKLLESPYKIELVNIKYKIKNREVVFFRVLSGSYKGSVLSASDVSYKKFLIYSYVQNLNKVISFKYSEVSFLPISPEHLYDTCLCINEEKPKYTKKVDKFGFGLSNGDYVAYISNLHSNKEALQVGRINSISNSGKIMIDTIPSSEGEKSLTERLTWKNNIIKLTDEQVKVIMVKKLGL